MITPESSWEQEWRQYEEKHLERPKTEKPLSKCEDCKPDISCYKLPLVTNVRLVNFTQFGSRTFAFGDIESCPYRAERTNGT